MSKATEIGHLPHEDVPVCKKHATIMWHAGASVKLDIQFSAAPDDGTECVECTKEAAKKENQE